MAVVMLQAVYFQDIVTSASFTANMFSTDIFFVCRIYFCSSVCRSNNMLVPREHFLSTLQKIFPLNVLLVILRMVNETDFFPQENKNGLRFALCFARILSLNQQPRQYFLLYKK